MLVVHPQSTCDVCLEPYHAGTQAAAIACGHVFCSSCLHALKRHLCPLCRVPFDVRDVRKLHLDRSTPPRSPTTGAGADETEEEHRFRDTITRIVREGDTMAAVRESLDEIRAWLKVQPHGEYADLRASFLLLYRYTDLQRQNNDLAREAAQARDDLLAAEREADDLRAQLDGERRRYDKLAHSGEEERAAARSLEKRLREQCHSVEREWKGKYNVALGECQNMRDEIARLRYNPLPTPPQPLEDRFFYLGGSSASSAEEIGKAAFVQSPAHGAQSDSASSRSTSPLSLSTSLPKAKTLSDMFRLSPVPATPVLADDEDADDADDAAFHSKLAFADADDEEARSPHPVPVPAPRTPAMPIRRPSLAGRRTSTSHSLSTDDDGTSVSRSLPRGYGAPPPSRPSLRSRANSHASTSFSTAPPAAPPRAPSPDPLEADRARWRSQLYDILDHPSTSRPHLPRPSSRQSTTSSPVIALSAPPRRFIPSPPPPTPTAALGPGAAQQQQVPEVPRPGAISHASTAALAAERARATSVSSPYVPKEALKSPGLSAVRNDEASGMVRRSSVSGGSARTYSARGLERRPTVHTS